MGMQRAFTTYCDIKNEDVEIQYTYWVEGDEVIIERVMMGKYDVTAPFMEYHGDEVEEAAWEDVRQ